MEWLPILVGAVLTYALGAVWYSPVMFSDIWIKARGLKPEDLSPSAMTFIGSFIFWLITAVGFNLMANSFGITTLNGLLMLGIYGWLTWTVNSLAMAHIFEDTPRMVSYISAGYALVSAVILALVNYWL